MQSMFKPKHQKLILQCYPSPKLSIAETKPNQAELSYLIFYASSRRTKLEKVGNFLLKKTSADISHKRVGHLKVTLYILEELITKCSEDLGFLTQYVVTIMKQIVNLADLSTCQLASKVFITYCETLQPIQTQIFSSDVNLLNQFLSIISKFLGFASLSNNAKEWLNISLNISLVVADYVDPSFSQFENNDLIGKSIHLILETLHNNNTDLSLVKVSSATSNKVDSDKDANIGTIATYALKAFFDTSSKRQLDDSIKNVLLYIIKNNKELNWANNIVIICTKKTHIELRHRIMVIISYEIENNVKKNNISIVDSLIKIETSLLSSSDVQFVGLPIMDILNQLIEFEKLMILNKEAYILKDSYSSVVRSLSRKIYYNTQINDMISEILSNYYYECNNSKLNDVQFLQYSQILIYNISDILAVSDQPMVKLKKSAYNLSLFNYLYLVLPLEQFPRVNQQVQIMWLNLLDEFYKLYSGDLSTPNIEMCIVNNTDNILCLFFESIDKALGSPRDEIKAQLAITISTMVKTFKLNFLINYLKYSSTWLSDTKSYKYSLSLLILGLSSTQIEDGKPLSALADAKIAHSQKEKIWPDYLNYTPSSESSSSALNVDELYQTLINIPSISIWLDKININQPPSISKQTPKQHNTVILLSASNSVMSLPVGKQGSNANGGLRSLTQASSDHHLIPPPISANSTVDEVLDQNGHVSHINGNQIVNETSNLNYSFNDDDLLSNNENSIYNNSLLPPNNYMTVGGGHSVLSGWSARSGFSGRRVNLRELKEAKSDTIDEVDLLKLVKTRTGGTFRVNSVSTDSNGIGVTGKVASNGKSGLAFSIAGLDLDDD